MLAPERGSGKRELPFRGDRSRLGLRSPFGRGGGGMLSVLPLLGDGGALLEGFDVEVDTSVAAAVSDAGVFSVALSVLEVAGSGLCRGRDLSRTDVFLESGLDACLEPDELSCCLPTGDTRGRPRLVVASCGLEVGDARPLVLAAVADVADVALLGGVGFDSLGALTRSTLSVSDVADADKSAKVGGDASSCC